MPQNHLQIRTAIQIQKPAHEVFEAIVNPEKMANYFISQSTGRMEEGKNLIWKFPEFDMDCPVRVGKIEMDKFISYHWDTEDGRETLVEITLTARDHKNTRVTVTEKSMENNEAGINWLKGNTEGWANFLACLKAWLEYGINLRKGAFKFMNEKTEKR